MRQIKNRKSFKVVTPQSAAQQLITTANMKTFLRVDSSADDTLIDDFVKTATQTISEFLRRSITLQTIDFTIDRISDRPTLEDTISEGVYDLPMSFLAGNQNYIELPFPPIVSITSITTYDISDNASVFDTSNYRLDPDGRVYLNYGCIWPVNLRSFASTVIRFVAGYGWTNVPLPVINGVRDYAATMYDCRRFCDLPTSIADSLSPYRILDESAFM